MAEASSRPHSRLEILSRQLTAAADSVYLQEPQQLVRSGARANEGAYIRPAPGGGKGTLTVVDNRSGKRYTVCDNGTGVVDTTLCDLTHAIIR